MNIKKYLLLGGAALMMGMSSCVGDLDIQPNDPNLVNPDDPNFKANTIAMCYTGIAVSGIKGAGDSYVEGLDAGTSAYLRCTVMLNEYPTDELIFVWSDPGIPDLVVNTWGSENSILMGAYYRFLGHIALCNQFLSNTADDTDAETLEMRAEARVLRAYSYYNMIDMFGQTSVITEEAAIGEAPKQISRAEGFSFIESELKDVVDNRLIAETPVYGRVGLDGAEALLARLYLNAEVFSGKARWADCQERCQNIIRRHMGGGFQGSGLAEHYLYLFCRDNKEYMPGGGNKAENEILFGISYDDQMVQSYGGSTFLINSSVGADCYYMSNAKYGTSAPWSCFRAPRQMAEKFYGLSNDVRCSLWMKGIYPAITVDGKEYDAEDYSDEFKGFTGNWKTCGGNAMVKFTGLRKSDANDGTFKVDANGFSSINTDFASTDMPIIRLADVYLMYTECYINGKTGDQGTALDYINYVRERAGSYPFGAEDLTRQNLMDERARELYYEMTRRTDLVRNGMFTGPTQTVWQFKGSTDDKEGTRIPDHFDLFPIPNAVLAAQPDFKQNPGY